ncbi:MAG: ABC transporter substrate-binding protein [Chloroflexi bacterium]|nr:ABC transporter substrate-binding protein [Chloroflexota bacterium]
MNEASPAATTTVGESPTPTYAPDQPATITWAFWGDPWEVEVNERVISIFEADHPRITVKTRHEPYPTYFSTAAEWLAGADPPDVLFFDFIPNYAPKGVLENLDPYLKRDNYDLTDFYPGLIKLFRYKDSLYGLPRDNDTKVIFYNEALFDEAGVPYPSDDWTWDDLREAAIKLTKRQGGETTQYGFAYEPDQWWRLWVWQNGGEVYDDDFAPTKTLINSPESVEAIQWLADLTNADKVTPPYDVQQTSLGIGQLFQDGKLAMAFGNRALMAGFAGNASLKWDVAGLPQKKKRLNIAGGSGYVIASGSKHKEAAWIFLKWLQSPKGQAIFCESGVAVPSRRSVTQADVFVKQQSPQVASVFLEETEMGRPNPIFAGSPDVDALFDQIFRPVWKGERTAQQAITEAVPRVNAMLAR